MKKYKVRGSNQVLTLEELKEKYDFTQFLCENSGQTVSKGLLLRCSSMGSEETAKFEADLENGETEFELSADPETYEDGVLKFIFVYFDEDLNYMRVGQDSVLWVYDEEKHDDLGITIERVE